MSLAHFPYLSGPKFYVRLCYVSPFCFPPIAVPMDPTQHRAERQIVTDCRVLDSEKRILLDKDDRLQMNKLDAKAMADENASLHMLDETKCQNASEMKMLNDHVKTNGR